MKVTNASSTSCDWLNLPEKSRPAKTKTFLIHSFGRPVLIAARSGDRRGTTSPVSGSRDRLDSAGTVGCSEVIVSIDGRGSGASVSYPAGNWSRERVPPGAVKTAPRLAPERLQALRDRPDPGVDRRLASSRE